MGQDITASVRESVLKSGREWAEAMRDGGKLKRGNNDGASSFLACLQDLMDDFTIFPSPEPWIDAPAAIKMVVSKLRVMED